MYIHARLSIEGIQWNSNPSPCNPASQWEGGGGGGHAAADLERGWVQHVHELAKRRYRHGPARPSGASHQPHTIIMTPIPCTQHLVLPPSPSTHCHSLTPRFDMSYPLYRTICRAPCSTRLGSPRPAPPPVGPSPPHSSASRPPAHPWAKAGTQTGGV